MYVSHHRHFCLVLLLNQRWSPPLRLQASHCSTFRIMCDVPSIAVFCNESIECFPGIVIPVIYYYYYYWVCFIPPINHGVWRSVGVPSLLNTYYTYLQLYINAFYLTVSKYINISIIRSLCGFIFSYKLPPPLFRTIFILKLFLNVPVPDHLNDMCFNILVTYIHTKASSSISFLNSSQFPQSWIRPR